MLIRLDIFFFKTKTILLTITLKCNETVIAKNLYYYTSVYMYFPYKCQYVVMQYL